ncbi:hypothetical protein ACVDG8_014710 [Mesorhizobium sp. ORM8.1]
MKLDDKPTLIHQLDPFLGWLEGYMLHRGPRITVTQRSISFFQALMRCARAKGHIPGSGRFEMIDTVTDGFMVPSKKAKCNAGMTMLLISIFNELLMESEPHIELDEFCGYLIEALELEILATKRGKEVRFTSSRELTRAEGVKIDVTVPARLRDAVEPIY